MLQAHQPVCEGSEDGPATALGGGGAVGAHIGLPQAEHPGDLNMSVDQLDALTEVIDEGLAELGKGRLQAWMVLRRVEELADELQDEGYDLVWSTASTWSEPAKPIRGRELREMALERI